MNYIKYLLIILTFFLNVSYVSADTNNKLDINLSKINVWDSFTVSDNKYVVSSLNSTDIYINGDLTKIYNFEITTSINGEDTWRKYVKLDDLCDSGICKIIDSDDESKIIVHRNYNKNISDREIYYRTTHDISDRTFHAVLAVGDDDFLFKSDSEVEKGFEDGVLTSDTDTLIDSNNDIYVTIRFITESLGAEVKWSSISDTKDSVKIEFYDNDNYCKNIDIDLSNACSDATDEELEKINKCSSKDDECIEKRCVTYLKSKSKTSDNSAYDIDIKYSYVDENKKTINKDSELQKVYFSDDEEDSSVIGVILYKGTPIAIDLLNQDDKTCENNTNDDDEQNSQEKCGQGEKLITDEHMIKLAEKEGPYCAIDLTESLSTSASR